MKPEISEFSYGFALSRDLLNLAGPIRAAPVFPSLIVEGRLGGGYDVNIKIPGFPLFLQFKRSDCMVSTLAREVVLGRFTPRFYRFRVTEKSRSAQHEMLLELDQGANVVFYAAPLFHETRELDEAFFGARVAEDSVYVAPSEIGSLDGERHHVAFDSKRFCLFSDPREIEGMRGSELIAFLQHRLAHEDEPFGEGPLMRLGAMLNDIVRRRGLRIGPQVFAGSEDDLRRLALLAQLHFNATLFIVQ